MRRALFAGFGMLLTIALLAPPAAAMSVTNVHVGAASFYTRGYFIVGWDDFSGGTMYDLRPESTSVLLKACYRPDNPTLPAVCFRDDPVLMASNSTRST